MRRGVELVEVGGGDDGYLVGDSLLLGGVWVRIVKGDFLKR